MLINAEYLFQVIVCLAAVPTKVAVPVTVAVGAKIVASPITAKQNRAGCLCSRSLPIEDQ